MRFKIDSHINEILLLFNDLTQLQIFWFICFQCTEPLNDKFVYFSTAARCCIITGCPTQHTYSAGRAGAVCLLTPLNDYVLHEPLGECVLLSQLAKPNTHSLFWRGWLDTLDQETAKRNWHQAVLCPVSEVSTAHC